MASWLWNPRVRSLLGLDATPEFVAPVRRDRPVLLVSGTLDSNTPVQEAEEVAKGFSNSIRPSFWRLPRQPPD
jgi:fermentation-respiration switch protein FrsA (DUF1100 family)